MQLRPLQPSDLPEIRRLYNQSRAETFVWLDSSNYQPEDFDLDSEGELVQVAIIDDQLAGFIAVWEPEDFIHHLYVASAFQNQGVGSQLLSWAKHNYPKLALKCMTRNHHALAFYQSRGFVIDSEGENDEGSYYLMCFYGRS